MPDITFKGQPVTLAGTLPSVGQVAPDFTLAAADLTDLRRDDLKGRKAVLSISASLDTGTCALAAKAFNARLAGRDDVEVVYISSDLPFAAKRFCEAESLAKIRTASVFRSPEFGRDYGVGILSGPLRGLLARAVLVLDEQGVVRHAQLVPEIAREPDYDEALKALG